MPSTRGIALSPMALLLLIAGGLAHPAPSQAQDVLFVEGFEGRKFCMWSASTSGETDCVSCVGKPDGTPCANTLITNCGGCFYSSLCDESSDRACDCITYACSAGACKPTSGTCTQQCDRNTDGNFCPGTACGPGMFTENCCQAGSCVQCGPGDCPSGILPMSQWEQLGASGPGCVRPASTDSELAAFLAWRDREATSPW